MKMIKRDQLKFNDYTKVWMNEARKKPRIAHGFYNVDGDVEGYWEGEKVDLSYPNQIDTETRSGFPLDCYPSGEIEFDTGSGFTIEYVDRDGEYVGYYDLIDQDFIREC